MSTTPATVTVSIWHEGNPHPHNLEVPGIIAQWAADTLDSAARAYLNGVTTEDLRENVEHARTLARCLREGS